ncbi:hypothetical protein BH11MYX2_BH11MYX2_33570 [soil metagenome]
MLRDPQLVAGCFAFSFIVSRVLRLMFLRRPTWARG